MENIASDSDQKQGLETTPVPAFTTDPQDPLPEGNFVHRRLIVYISA